MERSRHLWRYFDQSRRDQPNLLRSPVQGSHYPIQSSRRASPTQVEIFYPSNTKASISTCDLSSLFNPMDVPAGFAINAHRAGQHRSQSRQLSPQTGNHGTSEYLDIIAFKDQLESCLSFFRTLIEIMVRSTKESAFAGAYFHPIIRKLDSNLVRVEIWASEIGANEKDFGRFTQAADLDLELTRYITTILKDLQSQLQERRSQVEKMRSLIRKMSGHGLNDL